MSVNLNHNHRQQQHRRVNSKNFLPPTPESDSGHFKESTTGLTKDPIFFHQSPPSPTTSFSTTASNVRHINTTIRTLLPRTSSLHSTDASPPSSPPPTQPLPPVPYSRSEQSTPTAKTYSRQASIDSQMMDTELDNVLDAVTAFPSTTDAKQDARGSSM